MKLVQFADGTYGIRTGAWRIYKFIDLNDPTYSWDNKSRFFKATKGTRQKAEQIMHDLSGKHKVIKEIKEI